MNSIIQNILGGTVITLAIVYIWSKMLNKKPKFNKFYTYIVLIIMGTSTVLNYFYTNQFLKIVIITILMSMFLKLIFKETLRKSILGAITSQLIYMISEIIFAFGLIVIFKVNPDDFVKIYFGKFFTNFIIAIISILLIQIKPVRSFYDLLLKVTDRINKKHLIIMSLIAMIVANVLTMVLYYEFNFMYLMIFNMLLTMGCLAIILYSFNTKNNYIKVYDKYNTTLNSLKEYENIIDRYRVSNHENKNQLLTIRNMISKKDIKTISYIDKIIENKLKDNDKIMFEVSIIPAGGLRGLIYSKLLTMKNLKINYQLDISNNVKTVDLISLDDSLILDICQVIGVYLDNAIEEVKKLKRKYINIEMYTIENELIIEISNNYKGNIDIERLDNLGYTTKGKGHGYGLSLAKEIVNNNNKLASQKKMSKENFTQLLIIKM